MSGATRFGPQHLGAVDVADPGGDPLIEQRDADRGVARRRREPAQDLVEVGVGVAQVGAEAGEHRMPAQGRGIEDLGDGEPAADRGRPVGHEHGDDPAVRGSARDRRRAVGRRQPDRPLHPQVHVHRQVVAERDEQMFAARLDVLDRGSDSRAWSGRPRLEEFDRARHERGPQAPRERVDRVALGHGSGAQREPAVPVDRADRAQGLGERLTVGFLAVDPADIEPAQAPVLHQPGEGVGHGGRRRRRGT